MSSSRVESRRCNRASSNSWDGRYAKPGGPPRWRYRRTGPSSTGTWAISAVRYGIGVGISIDGPPEVQEQLRGQGGRRFSWVALLDEVSIPVRVTAVLSSVNAVRPYDLAVFPIRFTNIRGVGLDPLVLAGAARQHRRILSPSPAGRPFGVRALFEAVEQINRVPRNADRVARVEAVRRALFGSGPFPSVLPRLPGESLAVHPDGAVYPCGQTIGDPDMAAGASIRLTGNCCERAIKVCSFRGDCTTCPLAGRCPGDCPSRLHYNNGPARRPCASSIRLLRKCSPENRQGGTCHEADNRLLL